jgi:hypothetical protein
MKKLATLALLLAGGLSAADFSGIWDGNGSTPDPKYGNIPVVMQMTLLQAGNNLTGTIKINNAPPTKITSGSVNGSNATIVVVSQNRQSTGQITINGPQIVGRVTTSTGKVYTIVLKKR